MGRLLGIDFGTKRVGLAETDPMQIIASALDTIDRKEIIKFLDVYVKKEKVDAFIVGEPKQMDFTESESEKYIKEFIVELNKKFPKIKVLRVDERFTSKMAFQTMIDSGISKKARKNKGTIDKISATIILQSYLDSI
ncbi:MAG: Holliday junction resolvase RuvX [Ichthyobacteriaceae bacterium]|nr:Holliday junction resolvase RuvX [Ichthyobacteriaceae bacterium]